VSQRPADPTIITGGWPSFSLQYIGGKSDVWPRGPYQRYIRDLYGDPPTDWMPLLSFLLLALIVALVAALIWAVA
jgi:hypothetical protein